MKIGNYAMKGEGRRVVSSKKDEEIRSGEVEGL